jgi:hypothetical protein
LAESINNKSSAREAVRKRKLLETEQPQNSKECMKDCSLGMPIYVHVKYCIEYDCIYHDLVLLLFFTLFPALCNVANKDVYTNTKVALLSYALQTANLTMNV